MKGYKISKGILFACVAAFLWAFLAIALKVSSKTIDPATIVWFRFALAFIVMFVYMLIRSPRELGILIRPPWQLIVGSCALAWNFYGYMVGVDVTTPVNAQIYIQAGPVLFALSGILIYKEKITWIHIIGFLVVITGFVLFYSEQLQDSSSNSPAFLNGILVLLSAGVTWAVYASLQKFLITQYSANQLNIFIFGFCAILFTPFAKYNVFATIGFIDWVLLVHHAINTILAYGSIALAIKYSEANKVSLIVTLNPIITVIAMYIFGLTGVNWITHEHFSLVSIVGAALSIFGAGSIVFFTRMTK
jgi:drug/metabolite transporter (DMT)-like permease